jgi:hypothetical protein
MTKKIDAGLEMARIRKLDEKVLEQFKGRWGFMRETLENLVQQGKNNQ